MNEAEAMLENCTVIRISFSARASSGWVSGLVSAAVEDTDFRKASKSIHSAYNPRMRQVPYLLCAMFLWLLVVEAVVHIDLDEYEAERLGKYMLYAEEPIAKPISCAPAYDCATVGPIAKQKGLEPTPCPYDHQVCCNSAGFACFFADWKASDGNSVKDAPIQTMCGEPRIDRAELYEFTETVGRLATAKHYAELENAWNIAHLLGYTQQAQYIQDVQDYLLERMSDMLEEQIDELSK